MKNLCVLASLRGKIIQGAVCCLLLSIPCSLFAQGVIISGKVNVTPKKDSRKLWFGTILIKQDTEIIASGMVDTNYNYQVKIKDLKASSSVVKANIFITAQGIDTQFIKSLVLIKTSMVICNFNFPNSYEKNVLGEVICPKCGKEDKTIPIEYTSRVGIYKNKYGAGTNVKSGFSPDWYCTRCGIKF